MRLAEITASAGLPAGVFNVVTGDGATVGAALAEHPGVRKLAFTGATATGKRLIASAASTFKRVTVELSGKGANIVGATDGLGRALAHRLAALGTSLVLHGRSAEKGEELIDELEEATGNDRLAYELADFSSLDEIDALALRLRELDRIDVLVNNAWMGVELAPQESVDGFELTFQVDYLSTYVLSSLPAPRLVGSAPARIVNVASAGQAPIDFDDVMLRGGWDGSQAKPAQIMLTFDLAEQLRDNGVTVNALHPASYMPTKIGLRQGADLTGVAFPTVGAVRAV